MSTDRERAKKLAAQEDSPYKHWEEGFIAGYFASKQLTEAEWAEKREEVARAIFARQFPGSSTTMDPLESLESNAPYYYADADAAMIALGFTRKEDA